MVGISFPIRAAVAKSADAADLKSAGSNPLRVQVPSAAPFWGHWSIQIRSLEEKDLRLLFLLFRRCGRLQGQAARNRSGGSLLAAHIQVSVDIRCGCKIAMPQPKLDLLETDAIGQQQTCTAMPEIVKTYQLQVVFLSEQS